MNSRKEESVFWWLLTKRIWFRESLLPPLRLCLNFSFNHDPDFLRTTGRDRFGELFRFNLGRLIVEPLWLLVVFLFTKDNCFGVWRTEDLPTYSLRSIHTIKNALIITAANSNIYCRKYPVPSVFILVTSITDWIGCARSSCVSSRQIFTQSYPQWHSSRLLARVRLQVFRWWDWRPWIKTNLIIIIWQLE